MYDSRYFVNRLYFAYRLELKKAVQDLYFKILCNASRESSKNLLKGEGRKALDIGCAFGYVTDLLRNLGYDAIGLDISVYAIQKAHKTSHCEFIVSDARYIPIKGQSFDLITCFELIEHIPNPTSVIREVFRLLKKDGLCVWTTPNRGLIKKIYDLLRGEKGHISLLKPREITCLLGKYFEYNAISTHLLLPIPPQLFNKYFLLYRTPSFLSSEIWITSFSIRKTE